MDARKVDLIIQYALAVAGEADDFKDRELGPIHLVKFVYLADLAHAQLESGQTFTGAEWKFHHFGPWSVEVFNRIPSAAEKIGATERRFPSQFREEDARHWRVQQGSSADRLGEKLPFSVASAVRRAARTYANDTVSLLHNVYQTPPMLRAAPGELLDFREALEEPVPVDDIKVETVLPQISKTKAKELKSLVKQRLQDRVQAKRSSSHDLPPRYDEVFEKGRQWLDGLAGEPIAPVSGRLELGDNIWKSPARREPKLP